MRDASGLKATVAARLGLSGEDARLFGESARALSVPSGTTVIAPGQDAENYLFVLAGAVRMQLIGAGGRAMVLFRVEPGEACVLTTSCLLSHKPYPVEGVTEGEVEALLLPVAAFHGLMGRSEAFRRAVLADFGERVGDLLLAIEASVFERVEQRLARALLARADRDLARLTHAELAEEIGSAREVVSRQLARFARRGMVDLHRGEIRLMDRAGLARLAEG